MRILQRQASIFTPLSATIVITRQIAKPDMGKPLFKASDGGRVDILGVSEDVTESELRQVSEMRVLILPEVRP